MYGTGRKATIGVPAVVEAAFRHVTYAGKLLMLGSCASDAEITIHPVKEKNDQGIYLH
jgi:hypothetical protein